MKFGYPVELLGIKKGEINGVEIQSDLVPFEDVDTVTLYIGAQTQPLYYSYIISLNPNRVIFNPGTENAEFQSRLEEAGIEVVEDCTLVMLSLGTY